MLRDICRKWKATGAMPAGRAFSSTSLRPPHQVLRSSRASSSASSTARTTAGTSLDLTRSHGAGCLLALINSSVAREFGGHTFVSFAHYQGPIRFSARTVVKGAEQPIGTNAHSLKKMREPPGFAHHSGMYGGVAEG